MRVLSFSFLLVVFLTNCTNNSSTTKANQSDTTKPDVLAVNMDSSVNPAQNFFLFANGSWIKRNPIPGDQGSWGIGNLVVEENLNRLRKISEEAATKNAANGSTEQKIGDFWHTAMDSGKIEQQGLKPLQPYLDKINAITDVKSLVATIAELKKIGSSTLFSDYVTQDDKNSDVMSDRLSQVGIGLPDREY